MDTASVDSLPGRDGGNYRSRRLDKIATGCGIGVPIDRYDVLDSATRNPNGFRIVGGKPTLQRPHPTHSEVPTCRIMGRNRRQRYPAALNPSHGKMVRPGASVSGEQPHDAKPTVESHPFTRLPFRLILDILRVFFELRVPLHRCKPQLDDVSTYRVIQRWPIVPLMSQRDYFGYFVHDRLRTVFCLFWSVSVFQESTILFVDPDLPQRRQICHYLPPRLRSLDWCQNSSHVIIRNDGLESLETRLQHLAVALSTRSTGDGGGSLRRLVIGEYGMAGIHREHSKTSYLFDSECPTLELIEFQSGFYSLTSLGRPGFCPLSCFHRFLERLNPRCILRVVLPHYDDSCVSFTDFTKSRHAIPVEEQDCPEFKESVRRWQFLKEHLLAGASDDAKKAILERMEYVLRRPLYEGPYWWDICDGRSLPPFPEENY